MDLRNVLDEQALSGKAEQFQRIFFYRICGTGMAPAACLLKETGRYVAGFDRHFYPPLGPSLQNMDIECHGEVTEALLRSFDLIVVGNVVPRESAEARMLEGVGVPLCSFPAALGALVLRDREVIGICGTHGKTTTTYFALQVFEALGESPGYLIGGVLQGRPSSRLGSGRFLIEGDEYDSAYFHKVSKFRSYHLKSMILTSLEFDHADIFSSLEEIVKQFRPVIANLTHPLIYCEQYPAVRESAKGRKSLCYGGRIPQNNGRKSPGNRLSIAMARKAAILPKQYRGQVQYR